MRNRQDALKQRVMNGVSFKQRCNYSPKKQKAKLHKSFSQIDIFLANALNCTIFPLHQEIAGNKLLHNAGIAKMYLTRFRSRKFCLYYWSANLFHMYQLWQANQKFHPCG